jgi:hypothetical protein
MLQGAMRPHPELQAILDRLLQNSSLLALGQSTSTAGTLSAPLQLDYMTLHARVEPDMQKHVMCREKKVLNLTWLHGRKVEGSSRLENIYAYQSTVFGIGGRFV